MQNFMELSTAEDQEGVCVGERKLNNLRYADDTTLLADSEGKLQRLLDVVARENANTGLKVNIKKTFSMVIYKSKVPPKCTVFVNGKEIQQV